MKRPGAGWLCTVWLACASAAPAAPAKPPPALDYTRISAVDNAVPSPSGKRLALVTASADGRHVLSVLELPPTAPARVVGAVADCDVDRVLWVKDDRLVFHVGASEDTWSPGFGMTYAGDRGTSRLVAIGWWALAGAGDGSADVIAANFRSTVGSEPTDTRFVRIDTLNGTVRRQLDWNMPSHVRNWVFDAKGDPAVVQSVQAGRSKLYRRDADSGRWAVFADHALGSADVLTSVYLEGNGISSCAPMRDTTPPATTCTTWPRAGSTPNRWCGWSATTWAASTTTTAHAASSAWMRWPTGR